MGCGVSKESAAAGVLGNTVTQNGNAHHPNSNNKGKQANGSEKGEKAIRASCTTCTKMFI